MKAIVCEKFAPLDELQYKEIDAPVAGPGMVVLDVKAAGVNYPDGLMVQGLYQMKPPFPFVPGSEVAGVVSAVGEGVTRVKTGDRVIGFTGLGGYAEQVACAANNILPLPDSIPDEEAASLTTAHATAHHALKQRANIQPGETLVVTGAAGGTGLAAVQIGKAMGAKVIAVCSTQEKLDVARDNGADVLINYTEQDLKTELKQLNDGKGVDVVYECVGGDTFDACTRCMAWNGRLLIIGFASGRIPEFPVNLALVKGYSVVGVFWGSFTAHQPADFAENMRELIQWYEEGKVKVVVDEVVPLENTKDALEKVMGRRVKGKMTLKP
ncbi:NADPH:quinone oxidoreductase family protein [Exilibacterium tricleocarpae]|uniref:NADPH:quinone oxidoreductase family protein n=1 Tax=Exilibacterium tricleocarpae TaxID=2591008 RepID=A0A545U987_9GAMM|nr:NADPH:quinone oxidoreductase family protein [Exilibacterium tricleocarpae]TQV86037.1 NADPH:quinone oxidoreductase family protein [Exilibacterium tricleocarpae]